MRKIVYLLAIILFASFSTVYAQRTITGTVTAASDGMPLPGVTVQVKGATGLGTMTGPDGKYSLSVPEEFKTLSFSFVGMKTVEMAISGTVVNVSLDAADIEVDEVVVTALGITREKKSLGYAVQEVGGEELNKVKSDNFVNSISGKVSGVQIKSSGNMGGSTDVVIRGSASLLGNNQALFVIDGVPVDNSVDNNSGQRSGRSGYDYGNAVSDLNPNDIESMSVLKGAAATALYGSRAANGVILITTKKGKQNQTLGVNFNSNVTLGFVDKTTFPVYQQNYGAGYGPYYSDGDYPGLEEFDADGDGIADLVVPYGEDASMGQRFDPNLMVYQYDAWIPESPNFGKKTPYVAAENGPITFFETATSYTNSIDISGGSANSTFRLSYSNLDQSGVMPNSNLKKNNFALNGTYNVLNNLKVSANANFIDTRAMGRNSTGYSDNIMSSFRQWFQVNVDIQDQKELYEATNRNTTWNPYAYNNGQPLYWDNPYWVRYENFQTDARQRFIGYTQVDWEITENLSFMTRFAADYYSLTQEERKEVGSVAGELGVGRPDVTSGYSIYIKTFMETNFDALLKYNKYFTDDININAMVGANVRKTDVYAMLSSTNGGLTVPDLFALGNSASAVLAPEEAAPRYQVNGIFGSVSLSLYDMVFFDATVRRDQSSTLPEENNAFIYPSASLSFLLSNVLDFSWLQLAKVRLNYAEVGNSAPFASLYDIYESGTPFNGIGMASVSSSKNNPELRPETTKSMEAGFEARFFNSRVGFDVAAYRNNSIDQIIPVQVSRSTGYSSTYLNAGEIQNQGIELSLFATPVKTKSFSWDMVLNWTKNTNKVLSLAEGVENLQLGALQGGVTINARVGEPYGTIQGSDYVYYDDIRDDAHRVVASTGYYTKTSTSDKIIGNVNPDWIAGLTNSFSFGPLTASFLIDWKHGGSVFSLDQYYGMATGLYAETDFTNDLGNPVRNSVADGGGLILEGVYANGTVIGGVDVSGQTNTKRVAGGDYRVFGYSRNPNAAFVYDASYVKLREATISYNLPKSLIEKIKLAGASVGITGNNLWIIHKNLPHADPEASQGAGNIQGWQSGVMPTVRNIGFNVNLKF